MRTLILCLMVLFAAAFTQAQTTPTPVDCQFTATFTASSLSTASYYNRGPSAPCIAWRLTYSTQNATAVSISLQGTVNLPNGQPDPAGWTNLTVAPPVVNPATGAAAGTIAACCDYYPWLRAIAGTFTGTGQTMSLTVLGYKGTSASRNTGGSYTLPTATNLILGGVTMSTATSSVAVATDDPRNSNARLPSAGTVLVAQKFFGTAAPGSVATNLPGDLFTDTTAHKEYACNAPAGTAAPACTTVAAAEWLLLNGGGGAPSGPAGGALAGNYPNPTLSQPVQAADGVTGGDMTVRAGNGTTGRGGLASLNAGTSTSGVQGLTRIVGSWNGTATVNRIACVDPSASSAVTDCAIGANVGAIGVALTASTPVQIVANGDALLQTDSTAVVGGNVCISTAVAGQGHNAGFAVCPPGTAVGIVRSITALTSLGQATDTLPLVTIGVIAAGQAGSTGTRIVPGVTDAILEADNGGMVVYTAPTGTVAVSMDCPSATKFQRGWATQLKSVDANEVTITLSGACYFDNAVITTASLVTGAGAFIQSDGTNFYTQRTLGGTVAPGSIPYYSDVETVQPSGLLDAFQLVIGGGAGNAPYSIPANTTTNTYCLTQTGDGSNSADPVWIACPSTYTLPTATNAVLGGVTMSTATSSVAVATDDARNSNARLPSSGTVLVAQKFFGTAAPTNPATNLPGDLFTDTTAHHQYVCNAPAGTVAPACTSVSAAGWLQIDAASYTLPTATNAVLGGVTMSTSTSSVAVATDDPRITASAYPTVTDAAPIAWNLGSRTVTNGIVTLNHATSTRALNLTNLVNGGFYTLVIKQDATGGALMTLGTGCTWKVVNQGAGAIVLTAAANGIDVLTFTSDSTNCYAILQSNFN